MVGRGVDEHVTLVVTRVNLVALLQVAKGRVDQVQVYVVQLQALQRAAQVLLHALGTHANLGELMEVKGQNLNCLFFNIFYHTSEKSLFDGSPKVSEVRVTLPWRR